MFLIHSLDSFYKSVINVSNEWIVISEDAYKTIWNEHYIGT